MANRKTMAICLIVTGAVVLLGLLAIACYGEATRPERIDKITNLILIAALDGRPLADAADSIKEFYGAFLALKPGVDSRCTTGRRQSHEELTALLKLPATEAAPDQLTTANHLFNLLHVWLTEPFPTEKKGEAAGKGLRLVSVEREWIQLVLKQLKLEPEPVDLLAFEVWSPTVTEIALVRSGQVMLIHPKGFGSSVRSISDALCPKTRPGDTDCRATR